MRRNARSVVTVVGLVLAAAVVAVVGPMAPLARAAAPPATTTRTIVATSAGWFGQNGLHDAGNDGYAAGDSSPLPSGVIRDFFVFDLAGISGDVVAAVFSAANYSGPGAGLLTLRDVSAPVTVLNTTTATGTGVWADLGTGAVYGSVAVGDASATPVGVALNRSGVAAAQSAAGGTFSLGGSYVASAGGGLLFGSTGSFWGHPRSDVQLVLTIRPAPWPQFRAAPGHPGAVPAGSVITAANIASLAPSWQGSGPGVSSPAVVNGVVYGGSVGGKLYAFDASGAGCSLGPPGCAPLWTMATGNQMASSPAVAGGVVYVGSNDRRLYAVDAAGAQNCSGIPRTCAPLWSAMTGGAVESSPAVVGGVVYVGSDDGKLYAFDAAGVTGCGGSPKECSPLWTATTGGIVMSSPAVSAGVVYVGSEDDRLYAFDALGETGCSGTPRTCAPLWTAVTGSGIESSPAVAAGVVYVGSGDGFLYAFDAAGVDGCSGTPTVCLPLWSAAAGRLISSPAVDGGRVYVGSLDRKVYAFDAAGATNCAGIPKACTPLWTAQTGATDLVISSPAVVNGVVLVGAGSGASDHLIYAFDGAGLTNCAGTPVVCLPVWTGETGAAVRSSPAVSGGMVFAASDDGVLHAFGLPGAGEYHPLPPARALDTRDTASPAGPGATLTVPMVGHGGVPASGVSAVALNLTVTEPTATGYLTVFPSGTALPLASSIDFVAGQTLANMVVAKVGADGAVAVFNLAGATHVVIDVVGWFGSEGATAGARYHPLPPARALDTRDTASPAGPGATLTVPMVGHGGVPASGVSAVALNLTVTEPTATGYLTVFPSGTALPLASSIDFVAGQTLANMVVAKVGADGAVAVFNLAGATHVVIDVVGWFD